MKQNMSGKRLWFLAYLVYIATVSFVVGIEYSTLLHSEMQKVDEKIDIAVKNIKYVLPFGYHDYQVSSQEYRNVTLLLTELAKESGFEFFYTMVLKNDKDLYETASSEVESEDAPRYYSMYKNPNPALVALLKSKTKNRVFLNSAQENGTIHRIGCVREESVVGTPYLACADYDLETMKNDLQVSSARRLIYYLLLLLCVYPFVWVYKESSKDRRKQLEYDVECRTAELGFALKTAEKANQAKSNFLASMSHELRTPLNAIIGFSSAMKEEAFGPIQNPLYKEYASHISTAGTHLLTLINDILDLSKLESGHGQAHAEWVDMNALIQECLDIVAGYPTASDKMISFESFPDLKKIYVDPRMIRQVLLNLLSNAIKFTLEKQGKIRVFLFVTAKGELCFGVQDNGIGIPKEKLDDIFEPFIQVENVMTKKHQGTGLGLSLVKQIVSYHKGEVSIESEYHKGTKITIVLPPEVFTEHDFDNENRQNVVSTGLFTG